MDLQQYWKHNGKDNNSTNKLTIVLFIIYGIALCWILLFKLGVQFSYMSNRSVNLIPFNDGKIDVSEVIMNVIIFVPLGVYVGILFKRWIFAKSVFFFFFVSLFIEGLQFTLSIGAFDITDIITNTSGGIIGFSIFKAIEKLFKSSVKAQKFINIIATIGSIIMISLLFLLKINMLPVRYQ